MKAIVLERNRLVNRRLVRYFQCAGVETVGVHDAEQVDEHLDGANLIAADTFDGQLVKRILDDAPALRALFWTAEPLKRSLRYFAKTPSTSNVFGRPNFESPPRAWEVLMVLRRLLSPEDDSPALSAYLDWGYRGFSERISGTRARDEQVQRVHQFVDRLGAPRRIGDIFAELTHELLMNAMFDAPIDERGMPKYAMDRKASLELAEEERPIMRFGADGTRLAIQVEDPFGRLERRHVFEGLARGLEAGEMDRSNGGAGLGIAVCHNSSVALFYDVVRGVKTSVTGIFDLDLNLREFRTQAKSIHFFQL